MCSINDEYEEEITVIPKTVKFPKTCRSCDSKAQVVLRKKDVYCKNCFLSSSTHKFRATLGKSKMLKAGDKVLFVFSGNHSSTSLLHLLFNGLNEQTNKRIVFNVDVLFIDEGVIMGKTVAERVQIVEEANKRVTSLGFNFWITTLSEIYSDEPDASKNLIVNESQETQIKTLFQSVKTMSAKEDLLYQLRHKLMVSIGNRLEYDKIFTSETGTDLAIKFLVGISLGRGDQMSAEMGFSDLRNPKVSVLRPLKDFTQKEVVLYNVFYKLEPLSIPNLTTMSHSGISIQKTTEKFVNELQELFPSTVYTIFRTGDKLKSGEDFSNCQENCGLCSGILSVNSEENCSAVDALNFSKRISEPYCDHDINNWSNSVNGKSDCDSCKCSEPSKELKRYELEKFFCYGCSIILKDTSNKDNLPQCVLNHRVQDGNLQILREKISEFLID